MYCIKCGTKLPDDARFCSNCGEMISRKIEELPKENVSSEIEEPPKENPSSEIEEPPREIISGNAAVMNEDKASSHVVCQHCGTECPEWQIVCRNCGHAVRKSDEANNSRINYQTQKHKKWWRVALLVVLCLIPLYFISTIFFVTPFDNYTGKYNSVDDGYEIYIGKDGTGVYEDSWGSYGMNYTKNGNNITMSISVLGFSQNYYGRFEKIKGVLVLRVDDEYYMKDLSKYDSVRSEMIDRLEKSF